MATKRRVTKKTATKLHKTHKPEVCETKKDCKCHCFGWGILILVLGLLFLAKDYGLVSWFKPSWWSVVFVLAGLKWVFK
ncbi:hypothetical protein HN587_00175 [Candidatus Woesearchaeota archaeon]|jgi:hypothetical protein|nr:hypothetical protein [Candidatus Woesearchaeota archaeon]